MAKDRIALPDCTGVAEPFFSLTPEEKRALVLRIAQDGPGAIDAFIREREEAGDSLIARKLKRLREELLRRAEELRARLAGGFGERSREVQAGYERAYAALESERAAAEARLTRLRADEDAALGALLASGETARLVLDAPLAPPTVWQRVKRVLFRVLAFLLAPLRWFLRLFAKRRDAKPPHDKRVVFAVPLPGRLGVDLDARVGAAYAGSPALRRRVKGRLRAAPPRERLRRAWERLLGREDYESIAKRALSEMLAEEAEEKRRGIRDEESSLANEMQRLLEAERRARDDAAARMADLDAEREAEAARIERELASAPEREVKEGILDELKGSGLLSERGGKLVPTLAFMDRFSALIYADEARALGGGRGMSSGAYAEGEGTFVREPLRTSVEASHMDPVASLVRARQRHPHIRHLTEDDLLIYREEREALSHVVIILDTSGSMEESGRMEAAKRAALALSAAVKAEHPRNRVDFIAMSTGVKRIDALGVWESEPRGFTNTGAALRLAADLLKDAKSERGLVYLVTDGLPEAYTVAGEDVAGHPDKAKKFALDQAARLKKTPGFGAFVCLLLEPDDEMYVKAARELAKALDGRVVPVAPAELAKTMLREFQRGSPEVAARTR
ncbi:MAG: VWA domain-containing protein [Thermoplasmatota archaeon]